MSSRELYVIEARTPEGKLDMTAPQPEKYFGMQAITGISEDAMARVVYRHNANVTLDGRHVLNWPIAIDKRFKARRKTW